MSNVRYTVIVCSNSVQAGDLAWLKALVNHKVEVIVEDYSDCDCPGRAFNRAVAKASGQYCCFVDPNLRMEGHNWLTSLANTLDHQVYSLLGLRGSNHFDQSDVNLYCAQQKNKQASPQILLDSLLLFAETRFFKNIPFDNNFQASVTTLAFELSLRAYLFHSKHIGLWQGIVWPKSMCYEFELPRNERRYLQRYYGGFIPLDNVKAECWSQNRAAIQLFDQRVLGILGKRLTSNKISGLWRLNHEIEVEDPSGERIELSTYLDEEPVSNVRCYFVMGVGNGKEINTLLANNDIHLLVIEPEVILIRFLLMYFNWSDAIRTGRLKIMPVFLGVPGVGEVSLLECVELLQRTKIIKDNLVSFLTTGSTQLNQEFFDQLRLGVSGSQRALEASQHWQSPKVPEYEVTVISPYCSIFNDVASAFKRLGFRTRLLVVPHESGGSSFDGWLKLMKPLVESPSEINIFRNRCLLESERGCDYFNKEALLPGQLVSWWWDVPNIASRVDFNDPIRQRPALAFAQDVLGFLPPGSQWLPAGARYQFCEKEYDLKPEQEYLFEISFVGQSRVEVVQHNLVILGGALTKFFGSKYKSFSNDLVKIKGIRNVYEYLLRYQPELESIFNELNASMPAQVYYLNYLLQMSVTGLFRLSAIEALIGENIPVQVFGDTSWVSSGIVPETQYGGVLEPVQLLQLFNQSRINLNLNFMQVSSTVNPKVIDICASGNVALTDAKPEITKLYPDPACRPFLFDSIDGLLDRIFELRDFNLTDYRTAIGDYTRAHHSLAQRVEWIVDYLNMIPKSTAKPKIQSI